MQGPAFKFERLYAIKNSKINKLKNSIIILSFTICVNTFGQNLVPNPSFEDYDSLRCDWVKNYTQFDTAVKHWTVPTKSTSDIHSTLVNDTCVLHCESINPKGVGKQLPRSGNVMAATINYTSKIPNYREYLQVKLKSPLEVDETYLAKMYVSLANHSAFAINNIGMYFSDTMVRKLSSIEVLNFSPTINEASIIADSINWVEISGWFKADSQAKYLLIGNFYTDSNTGITPIPPAARNIGSGADQNSYHFIDDISVRKTFLNISNDTIICPGDSVQLNANSDSIIGWATDTAPATIFSTEQNIIVSPTKETSYLIYSLWDTASVNVEVYPSDLSIELGDDTTLCNGESLTIDATQANASYQWHDGSTDSTITVDNEGKYWVVVKHKCGLFTDTVNIDFSNCKFKVEMPNVFTPNSDGINDYFLPIRIDNYKSGKLTVFNRWGKEIYAGSLQSSGWDGKCNNKKCPEGVYYWVLNYVDKSKNSKTINGFVTLKR